MKSARGDRRRPPRREPLALVDAGTRRAWRRWLAEHHGSSPGVWLVFPRRRAGVNCMCYEDAIQEALCFGWVDSIIKRLDDARFARKFTPRKANSKWSTANRLRYEDLASRGLLAPAGLGRRPTDKSGDAPRPPLTALPPQIERELRRNPKARAFFTQLAPSYRRAYVGWIESAKREETRARRLREAVKLLAAGRRLGLK